MSMQKLFTRLPSEMQDGNTTQLINAILNMERQLMYQNNVISKFIIKQLQFFNSECTM